MATLLTSGYPTYPLSIARGMNGDIYGVNGQARGFRWRGTGTADGLGIAAPFVDSAGVSTGGSLTVTLAGGTAKYYVRAVDVIKAGSGYQSAPVITIASTGTGSGAACTSVVNRGRLTSTRMLSYGNTYEATKVTAKATFPAAQLPGGSGGTLTIAAAGYVQSIRVTTQGAGYTSAPTVAFTGGGGSGATARASINETDGVVDSVSIVAPGSGYTSDPTISFTGGGYSTTAAASVVMSYHIQGVTITAAGSNYVGSPEVTLSPTLYAGSIQAITTDGKITTATITSPGEGYPTNSITATVSPTPVGTPSTAILSPVLSAEFIGKYWMAIRYVEDHGDGEDKVIASSICDLVSVEAASPDAGFTWNWTDLYIDSRVTHVELWRTTADQAIVLYRVAKLAKTVFTYADTVGESELINPLRTDFRVLPILLPNGQVNARRFTPPPSTVSIMAMFQERMWYAGDSATGRANALMFSEAQEPESVEKSNVIFVQENVRGEDQVVGLMPFGSGMVVFQRRHCHKMSFVSQPVIDASISLIGQRGIVNHRCWDTAEGVAYVVDFSGMYTLEGAAITPISDVIANYWKSLADGDIDWAYSQYFFVRADPSTGVVRFVYRPKSGVQNQALCYHSLTKAWWTETYGQEVYSGGLATTSSGTAVRPRLLLGGQLGTLLLADQGYTDLNSAGSPVDIACQYQTGRLPLDAGPSRSVAVLYRPTNSTANVTVGLYFNSSTSPRLPSAYEDDGTGVVFDTTAGITVDMNKARSPLGDSNGYASAKISGRMDPRSTGTDRHLAVALSVTVNTADNAASILGIAIQGVGT